MTSESAHTPALLHVPSVPASPFAPVQQFHLFKRLPKELRLSIWEFAAAEPVLPELLHFCANNEDPDRFHFDCLSLHKVRRLHHVSQEARRACPHETKASMHLSKHMCLFEGLFGEAADRATQYASSPRYADKLRPLMCMLAQPKQVIVLSKEIGILSDPYTLSVIDGMAQVKEWIAVNENPRELGGLMPDDLLYWTGGEHWDCERCKNSDEDDILCCDRGGVPHASLRFLEIDVSGRLAEVGPVDICTGIIRKDCDRGESCRCRICKSRKS